MRFTNLDPKGFSMIELMVVLVIFGMLMTFGIPSFQRYMLSAQLRGTSENLVQTIQLQRSRAMATGKSVRINFNTSAPNAWTVIGTTGSIQRPLPRGVTYVSAVPDSLILARDGHVSTSGLVVFQNRTGARDTVSIQVSGMALIR
jgi:prepilin-type N-terminal cleavage/methylation domain-containing protein